MKEAETALQAYQLLLTFPQPKQTSMQLGYEEIKHDDDVWENVAFDDDDEGDSVGDEYDFWQNF